MFLTTQDLLSKYSDYANPNVKINRLLPSNKLFSLDKDIYTSKKDLHTFCISSIVSYISYLKALEYSALISERVFKIAYASFNKRKNRYVKNYRI